MTPLLLLAAAASAGTTTLLGEGFESGSLTAAGWTARNAYATVGTASKYAGSYGARLAGATWIERAVDTTGVVGLQLQFAVRTSGLDKGESLLVEWWDGAAWSSLTSSRATRWGTSSVALPAAAGKLSSFKLRFRLSASATDEYADLDSISLIGTTEGADI